MFCEEPVIAVYEGYQDIENANDFLDCYHDLAYHVTSGCRIVLETLNHYISLGVNGVDLSSKTCSIKEYAEPGECLDPFVHISDYGKPLWIYYESTLFVGERLLDVEAKSDCYHLTFDHFSLKIIPHNLEADDVPSLVKRDHWSYNHVFSCEHLLNKKCSCGGTGELLLDFVSDYVVRCNKCYKSTRASMCAVDAIKDWNDGELN